MDAVTRATGRGTGPVPVVNQECVNGIESNDSPNLLLDHMSNLSFEKIVELFHQGIKVDYNNDPNPEKFPQARSITAGNIILI